VNLISKTVRELQTYGFAAMLHRIFFHNYRRITEAGDITTEFLNAWFVFSGRNYVMVLIPMWIE
jgi:hypothetical protein